MVVHPYCASDSDGPHYEQYCHQKMMLHVKFRQLSNLLAERSTYTEMHTHLLQLTDVPYSLEHDVSILRNQEHDESSDSEEAQVSQNLKNIATVILCIITQITNSQTLIF